MGRVDEHKMEDVSTSDGRMSVCYKGSVELRWGSIKKKSGQYPSDQVQDAIDYNSNWLQANHAISSPIQAPYLALNECTMNVHNITDTYLYVCTFHWYLSGLLNLCKFHEWTFCITFVISVSLRMFPRKERGRKSDFVLTIKGSYSVHS